SHLVDELISMHLLPRWVHLANSAGSYYEKDAHFNLVRAGAALVGLPFRDDGEIPAGMRRSLVWKARLASCKMLPAGWKVSYGQRYTVAADEWIGALPVGYADGYHRISGNHVIVDGKKAPVVGNVCMDQCMIKLPKNYPIGSEVTLLGSQGSASIQVEDLCKVWNVVEDDVTSNIAARVPRIHVRD
ncbi:MAG: alanine racemase C-terminal domain-containing protein, partial [Anaerolineaceae bacterium]